MNMFSGLRGIFTAAAIALGGVAGTAQAFNSGIGSSNGERYFNLEIEDVQGNETRFKLPPNDTHPQEFKDALIDILSDYMDRVDPAAFDDRQSISFAYFIERVAQKADMSVPELAQAIGLDQQVIKDAEYKKYRASVLDDYQMVLDAGTSTDWNFVGVGLWYNDETIADINRKVKEAARQHPSDPAFKVRELTSDDLVKVRERIARQYVEFGIAILQAVSNKQSIGHAYHELNEFVSLVYRDIHKDPLRAEHGWDTAHGNKYNRDLIAMADRELAKRGLTGPKRDAFYTDLVEVNNFYNRHNHIDPQPPKMPEAQGSRLQTPGP